MQEASIAQKSIQVITIISFLDVGAGMEGGSSGEMKNLKMNSLNLMFH